MITNYWPIILSILTFALGLVLAWQAHKDSYKKIEKLGDAN